MARNDDRSLARRARSVSGDVEDYEPREQFDEDPSPEDIARFNEPGVVLCPECKTELMDDAAECWKCHAQVLGSDRKGGVPIWVTLTGAAIIVLFVVGYLSMV